MEQLHRIEDDRRRTLRLIYEDKAIAVVCDTMEHYDIQISNLSPLGMGVTFDKNVKDLKGKDVIIVAPTLIMYATITRMVMKEDKWEAGISAKRFSNDVLNFLFEKIGGEERI